MSSYSSCSIVILFAYHNHQPLATTQSNIKENRREPTHRLLNAAKHIVRRARAETSINGPSIARVRLARVDADAVLVGPEAELAFAGLAFLQHMGVALFDDFGGHCNGSGGGEGKEEAGGEELHL